MSKKPRKPKCRTCKGTGLASSGVPSMPMPCPKCKPSPTPPRAVKADLAKVICPACSHQFGAISQIDQEERSRLREKLEDANIRLSNALRRIAELERLAEAKPAQTEETEMVYTPVLDKEYCGSNCTQEAFDKYRQKYAEWRCWPATVVKGAKE